MWKRFLPLAVFLAMAVLLFSGIGKDTKLVPSPLIGKPAPAFELTDLNSGQAFGPASLKGQPYILNVFASWCVSCRIEHPVLMAYRAQGKLPVVGLNYKDTTEAAQRWLHQHGNPYNFVPFDETGRVGIDFGVYGSPETFFVDAAGVIRHKHVGPLTPELLDEWTRRLTESS